MQRMVLRFIVPNLKFFSSYLAYELHKHKKKTQGHALMRHAQKFLSVFLCLSLLACEGEDAGVDAIIDGGEIGGGVNIPDFTPKQTNN